MQQNSELQCQCNCQWFLCAQEMLTKKGADYKSFANALKTSPEKGRQNNLKIIVHGQADRAKKFLLNPVSSLFPNVFMNPASSTLEHLAGWALKEAI